MKAQTRKDWIVDAAQAMSDLNVFYVVISTLENGHLHTPSDATAQRIIKICKSEAVLRLRDYDRAVAHALADPKGPSYDNA